jgi:hypothetical protein
MYQYVYISKNLFYCNLAASTYEFVTKRLTGIQWWARAMQTSVLYFRALIYKVSLYLEPFNSTEP